ncbi:isocitrate dehydrogenase [Strigomonas culicis]|uniref:Isocitrate dehydrogenase [NADP] n=1 Tax=Strigomonas culicis TaxID=28005 RepID=S9UPN9_9TRYP|nr:isocitrate dehydrogenase [Strigomonas culicis]EPY30744.1 isocitrate dehydrogenase [Strigomonas culicis]EPY30866.1 isocitrate dehydrogenase [Strigomonas culicis]|eukprot:EPY23826.1 isocitrate dehydrogenase [Strigomonas culicis]
MLGEKITIQDGKLRVPDVPIIPFIEGDGIGKEITAAMQRVMDAAVEKAYGGRRRVQWMTVAAGEEAFRRDGTYLPEATMDAFRDYLVGIKGPLCTPVGGGIRSINVALRQQLDLYVCLRPVRCFRGISSPLVHPEWVDMVVFRENTEDIYAGIEWEQGTPEAQKVISFLEAEMHVSKIRFPASSSIGIKPVSVEGTERLVRAAIDYALAHGLPSVTLVHKGNIMKFTEGGFRRWGYALAEREYGDRIFSMLSYDAVRAEKGKAAAEDALAAARAAKKLIVQDCIADAFLQNTLLRPRSYSVIATLNLNGDYVSDQLAAMVGGIGIAPGANLNYQTGHAIFEATHGTAPDIVGEHKANPSSLLLSAVLLFDYLGWPEVGARVVPAMERLFLSGRATADLASQMPEGVSLTTEEFTEAIIQGL